MHVTQAKLGGPEMLILPSHCDWTALITSGRNKLPVLETTENFLYRQNDNNFAHSASFRKQRRLNSHDLTQNTAAGFSDARTFDVQASNEKFAPFEKARHLTRNTTFWFLKFS